ncbi:hypothetical protein [Falsiroseomonas sp.]|uniref:hypothetical protein n=1 Tax=Falsiroseomonas sp. TaxID=2870721 RepID=UPI003565395B
MPSPRTDPQVPSWPAPPNALALVPASDGSRDPIAVPGVRLVFIVDDDAAVRQAAAMLLSAAGYAVRSFAKGEAFLSALVD